MNTGDHDMNESEYAAYKLGYQAGLAKAQRDDDDAFWLRQYAGLAMQGILANENNMRTVAKTNSTVLEEACGLAKALLEEVKKCEGEMQCKPTQ